MPKKILFAYNFVEGDNEYVSRLFEITSQLDDVILHSGLDEFWNPTKTYDYIIINWPDYLFNWRKDIQDDEIKQLENLIKKYKTSNTKIINIRHDTYPHTDQSKNGKAIYDLINVLSDTILHLGNYSVDDFTKIYGKIEYQKHFVIPHILFKNFDFSLDRSKLRKTYGLREKDYFIFVPGNIRNYEEFKQAISIYQRINKKNKQLYFQKIQKSFFPITSFTLRYIVHFLKGIFLYKKNKINFGFTYLENQKISELFTISDLVLIPRINNLNSGNITLSAQFNKTFIAIESGNITEWTEYLNQMLISKKKLNDSKRINIIDKNINLADKILESSDDNIILNTLQKIIV